MADNPVASVKKFLPKTYLNVLGKNLPAIYQAFDQNLAFLEQQVQASIDQLFMSTASGKYLVQLGEEQGFIMPANSGLDIRSYKVLVPIMTSEPKQVRFTIDQLLQAFYLNERTRPSISATIVGPYSLVNGDDITIETEKGIITVSVTDSQIADITDVSSQEIASILNASQDFYIAESLTDRTTGKTSLRLISNTYGTGSFIRVRGGTMQNVFKFPNLVPTLFETGTTLNLTKTSILTDELRYTWDGLGTNPKIYQMRVGDVVTIRGLVDGIDDFSLLNGSYEIIDAGYDYFVVRNSEFNVLSSSFSQPDDDNIIITSSDKIIIFDSPEFALSTESKDQTITITVPAVPPLARRFLAGAAHIHGEAISVIDFTRTSLTLSILDNQDIPTGSNFFIMKNSFSRFDHRKKYFKTEDVNANLVTPTYIVNAEGGDYSVLPFTVPSPVGDAPLYGEVDSPDITLTFDIPHGLDNFWGFTLSGFTGAANLLAGDINSEHAVRKVLSQNKVEFRVYDTNGEPVPFDGFTVANSDVYRYAFNQSDGADFYMDFVTPIAAIASGLKPGMTFRFDNLLGTNVSLYLAGQLRYKKLTVTSINSEKVNFSSGLGVGSEGLIITSIPSYRSGSLGGNIGQYFLDKTSPLNENRVFQNLKSLFLGYTQSQNPNYVGPYVYDPNGGKSSVTISKLKVGLIDSILEGESKGGLTVDDTDLGDEQFPQTGRIVIDYGTSRSEGPIDYRAYVKNIGNTQILINPAYQFKKSHDSTSQIFYIHESVPYEPTIDGYDYPFYITGTTNARNTLFRLVELLVAAGIFVETDVILPDLRYTDPAIPPYD